MKKDKKHLPAVHLRSNFNYVVFYILFSTMLFSACKIEQEKRLEITGCFDEAGNSLAGTAEVKINEMITEIDCAKREIITFRAVDTVTLNSGTLNGLELKTTENVELSRIITRLDLVFGEPSRVALIETAELNISGCFDEDRNPLSGTAEILIDNVPYMIDCSVSQSMLLEVFADAPVLNISGGTLENRSLLFPLDDLELSMELNEIELIFSEEESAFVMDIVTTGCFDERQNRLSGTAEILIDDIIYSIECDDNVRLRFEADETPKIVQLSEGNFDGFNLVSPVSELQLNRGLNELNLIFEVPVKGVEVVIGGCLQGDNEPFSQNVTFISGVSRHSIDCPIGKRVFVESEKAGIAHEISYEVEAEGVLYRGAGTLEFSEGQTERTLILYFDAVAALTLENLPDASQITLIRANTNTELVFNNQTVIENIPAATYTYTINMDGYQQLSGSLTLRPGGNVITLNPEPVVRTGNLAVSVQPAAARITLRPSNGGEITRLTGNQQSVALPVGTYNWTVAFEDFVQQSGTITVRETASSLNVSLEPLVRAGNLVIAVSPQNANVTIVNRATNEVIRTTADQVLELSEGMYDYNVDLPGFSSQSGSVQVLAGRAATVSASLNEMSAVTLIEQMEAVRNLNQASQIFRTIPLRPQQNLSAENQVRFYNELYRIAVILYEGGDISDALQVFEFLVREDNTNFQSRLALGNHKVRNANNLNDITEAREYLRPMFGNLLFNFPPQERTRIELTARYFYALSYFEQIELTTDADRRSVVARQALAQLRDVYARLDDAASLPDDLRRYKDDSRNLIQVIESDILFGIN